MSRLPPVPDLVWRDDGAPYARAFDDIYYSRAGGLAETEAVFHAGCDLPDAWRGKKRFAICELGFGTGLNALATWRLWRKTRAPGARLHFVSIEAMPMMRADAARALSAFPEIGDLSSRLIENWPVRAYAPQRIAFEEDGFILTLLTGDAHAVLKGVAGVFDAFFLDGFAPARNTAMWSEDVAYELARLAAPGARVATYSVAGAVRAALTKAGFDVAKRQGFAGKRERLEGVLAAKSEVANALYPYGGDAPKRVAIIGGGIAGACAAHEITRRGAQVTLFEDGASLGSAASGNAAGLVMPRLDRGRAPVQELNLAAFIHAARFYRTYDAFNPCGVVERERDDLIADPPLPEDWLRAEDGAVAHLRGGVLKPLSVIKELMQIAEIRFNASVSQIIESDQLALCDQTGSSLGCFDAVVIANGATLNAFAQTAWLTLRRTAGQIEEAPCIGNLPRALAGESYIAPLGQGAIFGATFERIEGTSAQESQAARAENVAALQRLAPDIAAAIDLPFLTSRASVRAAAPDYAPIAGLLPRANEWLSRQADIAHGRPPDVSKQAPAHRNVYVIGALSARGLTMAPLLADRIASEMFLEPQALQQSVLDAIHPARFLHRMLKKGLTMPASVKYNDADSSA
ncbi:MAG: tRNA (5-methylaminomethyl-2-thiouridine)(34)-methyltransferase MnmD [Caulobacterales bacterium]